MALLYPLDKKHVDEDVIAFILLSHSQRERKRRRRKNFVTKAKKKENTLVPQMMFESLRGKLTYDAFCVCVSLSLSVCVYITRVRFKCIYVFMILILILMIMYITLRARIANPLAKDSCCRGGIVDIRAVFSRALLVRLQHPKAL